MNKPEDIPQDVWTTAFDALHPQIQSEVTSSPFAHVLQVGMAKAILAERERCYTIAIGEIRNVMQLLSNPPKSDAAWTIANRIKSGKQ